MRTFELAGLLVFVFHLQEYNDFLSSIPDFTAEMFKVVSRMGSMLMFQRVSKESRMNSSAY